MPETPMTLGELYHRLRSHFGAAADPDAWWPIFYGVSHPPEFERAVTNVLVQNGSWRPVRVAVEALYREGLLTAAGLARAEEGAIAECVRPTGLQALKARRLKALGTCVVGQFGTEQAFCAGVTREQLLAIPGFGPETADRALLYTCERLCWPVDTYCLRVLARYQVIPQEPDGPAERRRVAAEVKALVEAQLPPEVEDWRRLHALFQLEGERLRRERAPLGYT
jgi:endonuclease-3 related protein